MTGTIRTVCTEDREITYCLEYKNVKNLNLRIRKDGSVYVSANMRVKVSQVDEFVQSKGRYVLNVIDKFEELKKYKPQPKNYVSGETFYIQGRNLRLSVSQGNKEYISSDGAYIFLQVKDPHDFSRKHRLVTKFLNQKCEEVFNEVLGEVYPAFRKYGIERPILQIRDMETRWGSCLAKKGVMTLNKRLLEAPRNCIEYVVMHELCHFIHPNHSKHFYSFLTMMMPDWKERKIALDKSAEYWL